MSTRGKGPIPWIAFALMLAGLVLSLWGSHRESESFRDAAGVELVGDASRGREREGARALKNAGVVFVLAGPVVWLVGSLVFRGNSKNA